MAGYDRNERHSYRGSHPTHATACHRAGESARHDYGDVKLEVHCNTCAGGGAALCTYLHAFGGFRKGYLHLYVATYETVVNAKQVTPALIRRMCFGNASAHTHDI